MIVGKVKGAEARIRLRVIGLRGREREIEAVIDTGYTAALTLPREVITTLALPWRGSVAQFWPTAKSVYSIFTKRMSFGTTVGGVSRRLKLQLSLWWEWPSWMATSS